MTLPLRHFRLAVDHDGLPAPLRKALTIIPEASPPMESVFCDTFDWRLYRRGWQLVRNLGAGGKLELRAGDGGRLLAAESCDAPPVFTWDLPAGVLRELLEPVAEMRALLPLMRITGQQERFRVVDQRGKTLARLAIASPRACTPTDDRCQPLLPRLSLFPLKGYEKEARSIGDLLAGDCGLTLLDEDFFSEGLAVLGRTPGDYSAKVDVALSGEMAAADALRRILLRLLDTLQANEAGIRAGLDSEFLHDFRVAVRRTRSALSQVKGVFPLWELEFFRQEFVWLGEITGLARDLDVYLLHFPEFQACLPSAVRDDLLPFRDFLEVHRKKEYRLLARRLASNRYRKLIARWRDVLQSPGDVEDTPDGRLPVAEVASARIWKVYRRVVREGRAITSESPAEDLHELRKTCKKLRYLMEFFQSLYSRKKIGRLIKALKGLQDNLGTYQDLHVQVETLRRFSGEMAAEGKVPPETLLAMGRLVEGFDRRQGEVRNEFFGRFERFAHEKNHQTFRDLFKLAPQETA